MQSLYLAYETRNVNGWLWKGIIVHMSDKPSHEGQQGSLHIGSDVIPVTWMTSGGLLVSKVDFLKDGIAGYKVGTKWLTPIASKA